MTARARAAKVICSLLQQQGSLATLLGTNDDALTRELCFGTCRWYHRLAACLDALMDRPLKSKDGDVHALMLIGLYQLMFMRIPAHAAVNETVAAAKVLRKLWARSLVNGVLRNYQRREQALLDEVRQHPEAAYAHPAWLIEALQAAWPDQWQTILDANNQHPPMTLRNNRRKQSRDHYLQQLADNAISARAGEMSPDAIYLAQAMDVKALPGFGEGAVSVQDEASQLVPGLMQLQAGHRVLDACAAPGGKTSHLLEHQPELNLLALDSDRRRIRRVQENLHRLSLQAKVRCADATDIGSWWDGQPFDRILLDAPCTATGIIRRQPDIKLLRQQSDVARLAELQHGLLESLWPCLAPGGLLLYTTCSVLPAENREQIASFVTRHGDACVGNLSVPGALDTAPGRQLFPTGDGNDGFFYALLRKSDSA